ncbi:MAG: hypothetical protein HYR60_33400 [Acidobacteria bacterium]|nr:hypothetical protein [Acidobacteriota bacterium]
MLNDYTIRDLVLLGYKAFGGSIRGKTMLQKRMYFLSVILDADLGYGPHYYGPYSSAVAAANLDLKSLGFLDESSSGWGVDHHGFEIARYDFALTEDGKASAECKAMKHPELWSKIQAASAIVQEGGNLSYMELSIAAKAYFALTHLKGKATLDQISELMPQFGWSVGKDELDKASSFLEKASLVSKG